MRSSNQDIVDRYFEAYAKHDMPAIREVMDENVTWYFLGNHPLAGVKKGITEVIAFYDAVGKIMGKSKPEVHKLIVAEKENYFIEFDSFYRNAAVAKTLEIVGSTFRRYPLYVPSIFIPSSPIIYGNQC